MSTPVTAVRMLTAARTAAVAVAVVALALATPGQASGVEAPTGDPSLAEEVGGLADKARIGWLDSTAVGLPWDGALVDGVQLPVEGRDYFTWDAVDGSWGNPDDRRWGTDHLLLYLLLVLEEYRAANPGAPRVAVSDLSRPEGGDFGPQFGGAGHRSHQNGLDVDLAYPRRDGAERGIDHVDEIDTDLAQDLVDRLVAAGAQFVFVGENTGLEGPAGIVKPWPYHDDHLHLRIRGQ